MPLTCLATALLDVEAEAPGLVATLAAFRHLRIQSAYVVECLGVGGRSATGRAAYRVLVYEDDLVHMLQALHAIVMAYIKQSVVESVGKCRVESVGDQRAFARSRHAGDTDEAPQWEGSIYGRQVVVPRSPDGQPLAVSLTSLLGAVRYFPPPGEILPCQ